MSPVYPPEAYDSHACLKPSLGMMMTLAYGARHLAFIFLAYLPLLPGQSDLAFLKAALSPALVLSDVPALVLLLAWRNRRPAAAPLWSWLWQHGHVILLLTLSGQFALLLFTTALPHHLRQAGSAGLLAISYLALHSSVILYWLSSRRVRAVFREFPVSSGPDQAGIERLPGAAPLQDPVLQAAQRVTAWDASGQASGLLAQAGSPGEAAVRAWEQLGLLAVQRDRLDEGVLLLEHAMSLEPQNPVHPRNLCELYRRLGRLEAAMAAGEQALALQPADPLSAYNLALAQAQAGHNAAAEANYQAALRLAPDYAPAWNNLGVLLKGMNRPDEARQAFAQALAADPGLSEAQRNLAS